MRAFFAGCAIFFVSLSHALEIKEDFLNRLSEKQSALLAEFLTEIAKSSSGYVLFGDKPMDIQRCDLSTRRLISGINPRSTLLIKGMEFWESLHLSAEGKDYLLTSFEKDSQCHIVSVNKKAFQNAVQENLPLFRYVLGPNLTPDRLLQQLLAAKDRFYEVLKNDPALIGILLGNGTQNAILQARIEEIESLSKGPQQDEFPFLSKTARKVWPLLPKRYAKEPSLGFSTIGEEEEALGKLTDLSNRLKPFHSFEIPSFACRPNTPETKEILSGYEESRKKIVKATESKTFVADVLRKFFAEGPKNLEIPAIPFEREFSLSSGAMETVASLVEVIQGAIGRDSKKYLNAFLQGVAAREKGMGIPAPNHRSKDLSFIERELERSKNFERAEVYFKKLSERSDLAALVPKRVYFKTLKKGGEKTASAKMKSATFQYSVHFLGEKLEKDWGVVKEEKLGALIPGVAIALLGMSEGEERMVYIHPEYGYGEEALFPPNVTIAAQIRLLGFEEGEETVSLFPPFRLERRDYRELATRCEVLRAEEHFDAGVAFWDWIKKSGSPIDFPSFYKTYTEGSEGAKRLQSPAQEQQFVSDLEYLLLTSSKAI